MNAGRNEESLHPLIEPLTRREQAVLEMLAEGLTAGEMAERLSLAVSSVRWYVQQLYGKLGVSGKREAVAHARELGLLRPVTSTNGLIQEPTTGPKPEPSIPTGLDPKKTTVRHNLPIQRTSLVGRTQEVQQVKELLMQASLVTLTGSGGIGKTRLSLEVAKAVLEDFENGVWYVELAALSDPELVPQQVAKTLGVREVPGQLALDSLRSFLCDRQVLLVLDNCEHLLDACTQMVDALLNGCASVKVLTSSREPLGVAGEVAYRVPSLPFPAPGQMPSPERTGEYPALQLFIDRARLVRPGFGVTAENAAALARICQRLDGIPLAIELAAARTNVLTLDQLASRLDDAFRLLTGGSRSALPRQQTLRAAIDWSYKLLDERERLLFQRLAVFAGGCTLEAVEAVCSGEGLEAGEVLDRLASLAAKSMVMVEFKTDADANRYRLLETVRQYAREKLLDSGESSRLYTRHMDYFLVYVESNTPNLATSEQLVWTRKLEADHDNLRQALEWSLSSLVSIDTGIRSILAMNAFWRERYYLEPLEWFKRGIVLCQTHPEISLTLYAEFLGDGSHAMAFNDPQTALSWNNQSIDISRRLGPDGQVILIGRLLDLAWTMMHDLKDYHSAEAPLAEAETLLQKLGPEKYPRLRTWLATWSIHLFNQQGKYQEAVALAREMIQLGEKLAWAENIWNLLFLGDGYTGLKEYDAARNAYLEALRQADNLGDLRRPFILHHLGIVDLCQGNLGRALEYAQAGLQQAYVIPDYNNFAICLSLMARIRAKQGAVLRAARLSGAAHAFNERQGRLSWEDSALMDILPGWQEGAGREAIQTAYQAGLAMSVDEASEFGLGSV